MVIYKSQMSKISLYCLLQCWIIIRCTGGERSVQQSQVCQVPWQVHGARYPVWRKGGSPMPDALKEGTGMFITRVHLPIWHLDNFVWQWLMCLHDLYNHTYMTCVCSTCVAVPPYQGEWSYMAGLVLTCSLQEERTSQMGKLINPALLLVAGTCLLLTV